MDHTYSVKSAEITAHEWTPRMYQQFDNVIIYFMGQQNIPGGSLAVSLNNRLVYTQGYGVANTGQRVLSSSLFRLASISKTITAAAIMKLRENGQLQLDQKVFGSKGILCEFRPSNKGDKRLLNITVRHLLQHSAGWDRDQVGDAVFWKLKTYANDLDRDNSYVKDVIKYKDVVTYMMSRKLQFAPGKRHAYSNLGYLILGKVIERVSGIPYVNYVQEMCKTFPVLPGCAKQSDCYNFEVKYFNNRENILEPSVFQGEGLVQTQYGAFKMEGTESYGGLVMSAVDLLQLFNQINSESKPLLNQDSFKQMLKKPSYEHGQEWYGFGIDVQDNGLSWGHTGAMDGTSTTIHHHKSGLSWTLLFNSWSKDMDLDGLVKYGLSTISDLPLLMGKYLSKENIVKFPNQIVYLLMPIEEINYYQYINVLEDYALSHASMVDYGGSLRVNTIWTKTQKRHAIFIETNVEDVKYFVKTCNFCKSYVYLLESYTFGKETFFIVGIKDNDTNIKQEIYINVDAEEHLKKVTIMKGLGYVLKLQSVAVSLDSLFVSAVYEHDNSCSVSWVQITIENFIFELGKNLLKKKLVPIYVNCFNVHDEPYVSAVWFPGQNKQYLQRHDASIYGFLYELHESVKNNLSIEKICSYYNDGVLNFLAVWGGGGGLPN